MPDLMEMAAAALQSGDRKKATRLFGQVLAADPENITAWLSLAQAVDDPERKTECYQRVLRLEPTNRAAQISLSRLVRGDSAHAVSTPPPARPIELPPPQPVIPAAIPQEASPLRSTEAQPLPARPVQPVPARPARRILPARPAARKRLPVWWFAVLGLIVLLGSLAALYVTGMIAMPFLSTPADALSGRWELEGNPEEWLEFSVDGKSIMRLNGQMNTFTYQAAPNGHMVLVDRNQDSFSQNYKLDGDRLTFGEKTYVRAGIAREINLPTSYASLPPGLTPGEWDIPVLGAISGDENARLYLFADGTSYIHTVEQTQLVASDSIQVCDASKDPEAGYCMRITVYGGGENYVTVSMRVDYLSKNKLPQIAADFDMGRTIRNTSSGDPVKDLPGRWLVSGSKMEYEFKPGGVVDEFADGAFSATNTYVASQGLLVFNTQPEVAYTLHSLGGAMLLVPNDPNLPAKLLIKK